MSDPVSATPATAAAAPAPAPVPVRSTWSARHLGIAGLVLLLIILALCVYVPRLFYVSTDDAYVQADTVTVVPKVAAYVATLHVSDNTAFNAGQLLVELDPRDYLVALNTAVADLAAAKAARTNLAAQIVEQQQRVSAAQAAVEGDRSTLAFAEQQRARYGTLSRNGADTKERLQQADADLGVRRAALSHDLASLAATRAHVAVLQSQSVQADADVAAKQAALDQAKLNLSYTKIYADAAGTVANRSVQVGNYVQPGQSLFSAVPREVFVVANVKETQLDRIQPGQAAEVSVDALSGRKFRGHVDSIQRGTGSNFALLPPENATGNFVKIVQRVPVKIVLDEQADLSRLSPGMSVVADIVVRKPPF
jgi:membrane fusion protein, multidrug efflux system